MAQPLPTWAEAWAMIRQAVKIITIYWRNAVNGNLHTTSGNNLTNQVGVLSPLIEGVYAGDAEAAARAFMDAYSGLYQEYGRLMLDPLILEMGRVIESVATTPEDILQDLYRYMDTNSKTIVKRGMSFDTSPTAGGSNQGDGTVVRLTVDRYGRDVENAPQGGITLKCTLDRDNGGLQHSEQWLIQGVEPQSNLLATPEYTGIGTTLTAGPINSILNNSNFGDDSSSFPSNVPTGWTSNVSLTRNTSTKYIGACSVEFTATGYIQQTVPQSFDSDVPYCAICIWNRNGSSGSFDFSLGTVTSNVTVAAQSGWQTTTIAKWYKQFKDVSTGGILTKFSWTKTSGNILVGAIILVPMSPSGVDGTHFTVTPSSDSVGGYEGENDTFTFGDTHSDGGQIQFTLYMLYGQYLPFATSGAETEADPTYT